MGHISSIIRS